MWLKPAVRIALCGALGAVAGCGVSAPGDTSSEVEAQRSALTQVEPNPSFADAFDKTFPNDAFAQEYAQDALPEVYDEGPRTQTQTQVVTSGTKLGATSLRTAGAAGASAATSVQSKSLWFSDEDTTCDRVDDDRDGEVDEDCDFGPEDCPAGMHVIAGTGGWDLLWGTSAADCILGYGGSDLLVGGDGADLIVGGPGNDAIRGSRGNDQLLGSSGDDLIYGDENNDYIDGGDGNDAVVGGSGYDNVNGGACHDLIVSSYGTDTLRGDAGSDRIEGSAPHSINGGVGYDACSGPGCEISCAAAGFCLWDGDCGPGKQCTPRSHICAPVTQAPIHDKTCDGLDDDCDGEVDEEYASVVVSCACGGTSTTECVDGVVVDACASGGGGSSDATCDGIDDDCDAVLDEDFVPSASTCGVGACSATGTISCVGGAVHDGCVPGTPAASDATCDLIDDDCSGAADEDYAPTATSCDVAGCMRLGLLLCTSGVLADTCSAAQPCVAETACADGVDNDGDLFADCDDADCSDASNCQVQTFSVTVNGTSSLWGAGLPAAPGGGDLPPGILLELTAGAVVRFTSITGLVSQSGAPLPPDGFAAVENLPNSLAIAGYSHATRARLLAGIFLDGLPPAGFPPPQLSFADQEFTLLSPALRQIFPIGDGLTSGAVQHTFVVPPGATRLFVGITDRCPGNIPGCYGDNSGSFSVSGEVRVE